MFDRVLTVHLARQHKKIGLKFFCGLIDSWEKELTYINYGELSLEPPTSKNYTMLGNK